MYLHSIAPEIASVYCYGVLWAKRHELMSFPVSSLPEVVCWV